MALYPLALTKVVIAHFENLWSKFCFANNFNVMSIGYRIVSANTRNNTYTVVGAGGLGTPTNLQRENH